jgi:hypothetical protein
MFATLRNVWKSTVDIAIATAITAAIFLTIALVIGAVVGLFVGAWHVVAALPVWVIVLLLLFR